MSTNAMTLDDIRNAAERKYGSLDLEVDGKEIKLLNPIRLPKEKRAKMAKLQEGIKEEGADQVAILQDVVRTVCDHPANAKVLLAAIGDDLAVLAELFQAYGKRVKLGEASASHSS